MASGMVFMFICYLIGIYNLVEGDVNLSRQEELELEKQLKLLNKPSIKTIKTDYEELYDCVDFYKQPAFDLPALKNHSYHFDMKPQFRFAKKDQSEPQSIFGNSFRLRDGGCPVGTVPIRRTTKEDLIRQKFASKDTGVKLVAVGHSPQSYNFRGALALLSIYKPQVHAQQYSAARIVVRNDDEFIEYGWRVDPYMYGDNATHFYIQTNASSGNCYDAKCGFVVTSLDTSPGLIYSDVTVSGDIIIYEMKPRVQQDDGGNWWLSIDSYNRPIGFWPHGLFTKLSDNATYVEWGGEVFTPSSIPGPQMGSGVKPDINSKNIKATTAFFRWIAGINMNGSDFNLPIVKVTNDQDGHYGVADVDSPNPDWGHHIFFGGKGDV